MNMKHLQVPDKQVFLSEEEIQAELASMEENISLNTNPSYGKYASTVIHLETFQERHMDYLKGHPKVNPAHYLANLRTILRIRA